MPDSYHPALLFLSGCIAVTSAEDGGAETTQYLILQGPDDGKAVPWDGYSSACARVPGDVVTVARWSLRWRSALAPGEGAALDTQMRVFSLAELVLAFQVPPLCPRWPLLR